MINLGVDQVLIINSEAIDEYPLWASDSKSIAVNIMGRWRKFNLNKINLLEGKWGKKKVGVAANEEVMSDLTDKELTQFNKFSKNGGRKITTSSGEKVELNLNGFSSSLVITKNNTQPTVLWSSAIENCHSLSLSPNQKYVAYICELSGVFLMKI